MKVTKQIKPYVRKVHGRMQLVHRHREGYNLRMLHRKRMDISKIQPNVYVYGSKSGGSRQIAWTKVPDKSAVTRKEELWSQGNPVPGLRQEAKFIIRNKADEGRIEFNPYEDEDERHDRFLGFRAITGSEPEEDYWSKIRKETDAKMLHDGINWSGIVFPNEANAKKYQAALSKAGLRSRALDKMKHGEHKGKWYLQQHLYKD
jgi:hypothetical protein